MASIFSRIISGEIPGHIIAQNDSFIAFLDITPVTTGHTLVVPKREIDFVFDLSEEELSGLMAFAKAIAIAIKAAIPCKKIGVSVIGLEVPHAHMHLMPINTLTDMDFTRPKMQVSQSDLAATAELIKSKYQG